MTFRAVGCTWAAERGSGLIQIPGRISNALGRRILALEGLLPTKQNPRTRVLPVCHSVNVVECLPTVYHGLGWVLGVRGKDRPGPCLSGLTIYHENIQYKLDRC